MRIYSEKRNQENQLTMVQTIRVVAKNNSELKGGERERERERE